jgi:UDP-N-acetylglucosamine--N-acetylmuramyl-(pentapeptide) pyrophosphoryl-undecaprenol N-acetylglucosamine transferase
MTPGLMAARLRRVPYVLQVFEARGLANRLFRSGATAASVTFPRDVEEFPTRRTVLTGYPLRPGFARRVPRTPPETLLVMGGSQGARRLNRAVWDSLDELLGRFREVIHLTGRQGEAEARALDRPGYRALPFSTEIPRLMGEADLVVCRAGVGACAEVTAVGLPAILVPGTFGGGHQERNARDMVAAGAAVRLADDELSPQTLVRALDELDPDRLRSMAEASRALGRPDAARAVVRLLEEAAA